MRPRSVMRTRRTIMGRLRAGCERHQDRWVDPYQRGERDRVIVGRAVVFSPGG